MLLVVSTMKLSAQNNKLLGTWESKDRDLPVQMILDERGFITFRSNGILMGGVGYNIDGEMLRMTYKIIKDRSKMKISITIRDLLKKEILKRDTGSIEFLDSNNIKMCFKRTLQESNSVANDCRYFLKID